MGTLLIVLAVIWGSCTVVVVGAVSLSRMVKPLGTLLFEPPQRTGPRPADARK